MAIPMQFCMETNSDWLKAIIQDEGPTDNSSSPSEELILPCPLRSQAPPMLERRLLRPPHGQLALKCPRCESTHTKFCYYNNYSLSQPRYFCKTCRRYWTRGGSLRNVPVGGGCRKNKRKKSPVLVTDQISSMIHHQYHPMPNNNHLNFMFDSATTDHFGSGFGFGIGLGIQNPLFGEEEEIDNNAVEEKPGTRMLSLEWPDDQAGCGDSFGYSNGLGLWAGMLGGRGSNSSAAM